MRAALAAVLALSVPAGAQVPLGARKPQPTRNPGAYVHLTTRPWFTLDPAAAFDAVSAILVGNLYEPLITFKTLKEPDSFAPFLAAEVPTRENGLLSADGTVYRFPIRKDVRFHEGQALTPEDVRYSLLRFMLADPAGGPSNLLLRPILGASAGGPAPAVDFRRAAEAVQVSGDSVVIRLKRPNAHFLRVIASLPIVVSKEWCVAHGEWDGTEPGRTAAQARPAASSYLKEHANGTGAFRLESADPAKEAALSRHDGYWRKPAALSRVLLRVVPNPALRLSMLENGDADGGFLEDQDYADARDIPELALSDCPAHTALGEVLFFTFDAAPGSEHAGSGALDGSGVPPDFFADKNVREGFALALDYEGYLRRGMGLRGKRAAGPFPEAFVDGQPPATRAYDLEAARRAFRRARGGQVWEKGFAVTLAYSPSVANRRVLAELLRAGLEKVNPKFNLRLKAMSSEALYEAAEKRRLPLFLASYYADYPDPQSMAFGLLHSAGYYPQAQRYFNPKLDRLIERAETEPDRAKRRALYHRIQAVADADIPQVYTYNPTRFRATRTWVEQLDPEQNVANLNLNNFPYFYSLAKPQLP